MENKLTETSFKPVLGVAGHLFSSALCLGAVVLICSSALAEDLYVSDGVNGNIYEFSPGGVRSTFNSSLNYIGSLAFDSAGNLFVSDTPAEIGGAGAGKIYKFTPEGLRITFAVGLNFPILAFDRADNLFAFDISDNVIYKFTPAGVRSTFSSGRELNGTTALACDSAGNLFVSVYGSGVKSGTLNGVPTIYKITPSGMRTTFASASELNAPLALAFDSAGNLFVSDDAVTDSTETHFFPGAIYKFTPNGVRSTLAPGFNPFWLAFDSAGNLFAADDHDSSGHIYKLTPSGARSTFASGLAGFLAFGPPTPKPPDFNNDGKPDFVLYNANTHQTAIWYMNNNVHVGGNAGPTVPGGWSVVSAADFNRNGHPDYLLFNSTTRATVIWYMNNNVHVSGVAGPTLPNGWDVVALADFNRDGYPDYLLFNASSHQIMVWYMHNNVHVGEAAGPTLPGGWRIAGAADFNGDGHPDYLLFRPSTGQSVIWYLNGATHTGSRSGPTIPAGYDLVGAADLDGNGKPDYMLYNPTTHRTAVWYMDDYVCIGTANGPTLPAGWGLVAP